jgi:choline monooxygenase
MRAEVDTHPEIARFKHTGQIEYVQKPPSSWYQLEDIYQLEQERIFEEGWYFAGPADWVQDGGYWVPKNLPFPTLLTRVDGKLHAFHNVCLHHKAEVADGQGKAAKFSCPYHGWTYGLDGKLRGTPHLKERPPCLSEGLERMSVVEIGPLVFVSPKGHTEFQLPMSDQFRWEGMRSAAHAAYQMDCNWKIYVENYLDGGYHVPILHKNLTKLLDLETYKIKVEDGYVVQSVEGGDGLAHQQKRIGDGALYVWYYPNFMINRYGPWLTLTFVTPLSNSSTRMDAYYFLEGEVADNWDGKAVTESAIEASSEVTYEDISVCESTHRGVIASDSGGVYVPKFESGQFYFHQKLAEDLS